MANNLELINEKDLCKIMAPKLVNDIIEREIIEKLQTDSCPTTVGTTTISQLPIATTGGYCGSGYGCSENLSGIPFIYSYATDFTILKRIKTIEQSGSGDQGIYWLVCNVSGYNLCPHYSNYLYVGTSAPSEEYRSFTSYVDGIYFGSGTIGWKRADYVPPNNYRVRLYVIFTSLDTTYADTLSGTKEITFDYDNTVFTNYFNSLSVSANSTGGSNFYARGSRGFRFRNLYLSGSLGADGYKNDVSVFYTNTLIDNLTYNITIPAIKYSGDTVTMKATPIQGVAPYTVQFRKSPAQSMGNDASAATEIIPDLRLPGGNNISGVSEGTAITRVYTLNDSDLEGATAKIPGEGPSIIFTAEMVDSCAPPQSCIKYCKVLVGCTVPICDFTVT